MSLFNLFGLKKSETDKSTKEKPDIVQNNSIKEKQEFEQIKIIEPKIEYKQCTLTGVKFIKEYTSENKMVSDLELLATKLQDGWKKNLVLRDIKLSKWGKDGENNVYFELNNSFLPMLCLYDVRLEYKENVAQFDFIVITKKFILVIETKNLTGNIKITEDGSFIRQYVNSMGEVYKEEGMYSPVTQNERHCRLLESFLKVKNSINKIPILSIVVLGNPKTIIDKTNAPEEVSNKLIRVDQLVDYLKDKMTNLEEVDINERDIFETANYLKRINKPITFNYLAKYTITESDYIQIKKDVETLTKELKAYRMKKANEENVKPYMVYNNAEMEALIEKYPKTKEDILSVKGFGELKVRKYGDDLLRIFKL